MCIIYLNNLFNTEAKFIFIHFKFNSYFKVIEFLKIKKRSVSFVKGCSYVNFIFPHVKFHLKLTTVRGLQM